MGSHGHGGWTEVYGRLEERRGRRDKKSPGEVRGERDYRKYRSLGTRPGLTFQARLLHNQEDVNTDVYTSKESSRRDISKTARFGIGTLLVVEQSSLESQSRGCAKTFNTGS